ncbi:hypothetical protein ACS0TY_027995 [Phlomoides rotata]
MRLNQLSGKLPNDMCSNANPKLKRINLSTNKLSGEIPAIIRRYRGQEELHLPQNRFEGSIPGEIGVCQSLEFLSLSNNKFGGSIPVSLGKVRGLRTLKLSNNELSGEIPESLVDLRVLEHFDVSYNKLEGIIPNGIANSTAPSFAPNSALCGAAKFQVLPCVNDHGRSRSRTVALIFLMYIVPPFVAATIVMVVVLMLITRRKRIIKTPATDISLGNFVCRRISYIELLVTRHQMFTRKKPTDDMFSEEMSLKDWVDRALQEIAVSKIVAPGLVSRENRYFSAKEQCVSSVFDMAMKCLSFTPDERINMIQVNTHKPPLQFN